MYQNKNHKWMIYPFSFALVAVFFYPRKTYWLSVFFFYFNDRERKGIFSRSDWRVSRKEKKGGSSESPFFWKRDLFFCLSFFLDWENRNRMSLSWDILAWTEEDYSAFRAAEQLYSVCPNETFLLKILANK